MGPGMALLGMNEVGELVGIPNEEHGRVVADQIPVAFIRIELDREAAHVPLGIGGTELTGPRREGILVVGNRIARARGQLIGGCS